MGNNNWFIGSISLTQAIGIPTKEEMEKLLPSIWPARWEEVDRYLKDGVAIVSLAHINPDPENATGIGILKSDSGVAVGVPSLKPEKFDFVGHIHIAGYADNQTARQFFESYQNIPIKGLGDLVPGMSMKLPLGDLISAFAPKEVLEKLESVMEKGKQNMDKSDIKIGEGRYLGEEAILTIGKDVKKICNAVLVNNFVVTGLLLMSDALESGSVPIHIKSVKCSCKKNYPCSTRKDAGYVYKEEVEHINKSIFSKIKGEDDITKETNPEIEINGAKIINPKEKSKIKNEDTIKTGKKTQVNIMDSVGNKICIGDQSTLRIKESNSFDLLLGSVTAFIKKLTPKSKYEIITPTAVIAVRGTVFSVWTDKQTTSLTVIEGEIEFSDLKGSKVIVKENQTCVCSKSQGLQKPVALPVNLKKQFKEKI